MLTLKGTKYTVKLGDVKFSGNQKVDPTRTPKEIDATDTDGANKDKTILIRWQPLLSRVSQNRGSITATHHFSPTNVSVP